MMRVVAIALSFVVAFTPTMASAQQRPVWMRVGSVGGSEPVFSYDKLHYEGAFKAPEATTLNGVACGGHVLCTSGESSGIICYDSTLDGGAGGLWLVAGDGRNGVMFAFSRPGNLTGGAIDPNDTLLSQMPTAVLLKEAADMFAGHLADDGADVAGGCDAVTYNGTPSLLVTSYIAFDADVHGNKTHFIVGKDPASPTLIEGPRQIANGAASGTNIEPDCRPNGLLCPGGWVAGQQFEIPSLYRSWFGNHDRASALRDVSIIGRTSHCTTLTVWTLSGMSGNVAGKRVLGYPTGNETLGKWTTGSDGATTPGGSVQGTGQCSSQNDYPRMFWPTGYRGPVDLLIMGNTDANNYGAAVAEGDGSIITASIGEMDSVAVSGTSMSATNGSPTITGVGTQFLGELGDLVNTNSIFAKIVVTKPGVDTRSYSGSLTVVDDTTLTLPSNWDLASGTVTMTRLLRGANASTDASNGCKVYLPYQNVDAITLTPGHGYLGLYEQATPETTYAGRTYRGMSEIVSVSGSGTAGAYVIVADCYATGLTGQDWRSGAPAAYDPSTHHNDNIDTEIARAHSPTAWPYECRVRSYDGLDLKDVYDGNANYYDPVPDDDGPCPTFPKLTHAGTKYESLNLGNGATHDPVARKVWVTQRHWTSGNPLAIMQFGYDAAVPPPTQFLFPQTPAARLELARPRWYVGVGQARAVPIAVVTAPPSSRLVVRSAAMSAALAGSYLFRRLTHSEGRS